MENNVLCGNNGKGLTRELVYFSIPLILSGLLQQMYSWADAFIIGNIVGEAGLAAIGTTVSISELFIQITTGFAVGLSIMAAHSYGNGRKSDIPIINSIFCYLSGILFLIVAILCSSFSSWLTDLMKTPDNLQEDAQTYLRIIFLGMPFSVVYNTYTAVLRGIGESKIPFISVLLSVATNVVLDLLFVKYFGFGVAGAAIATVISQVMLLLIVIWYTPKKYPQMQLQRYSVLKNKDILKKGVFLGIPTALQSSITACGNLLLQKIINEFGAQVVAAITVSYRIDGIIMLPILNLGSAISTMTAQSVGAGNNKRAKKSLQIGMAIMIFLTAALSLIMSKASIFLVGMFRLESEAAQIGQTFFSIIIRYYVVYGIAVAIKSYLEGRKQVIFSGVVSFLTLSVRIVLSYALREQIGSNIIAYAEGFSWVFLFTLCLVKFVHSNYVLEKSEKNTDM